ncbi:MAG: urease accessory protein UreF [Gammaproteobacteria bacterium]
MASARFRLWQLLSPTLPIGAYAYSQGLEYAVGAAWVREERDVKDWIEGQAKSVLGMLDVPVLARLYRAWSEGDARALEYWSRFLLAARESSELLAEERNLGTALAKLLLALGVERARAWCGASHTSYAAMFALGTWQWDIPVEEAAEAYVWTWCEKQVAAAVKLVPLGQTAGQRLLWPLADIIPQVVERALVLKDEQIGGLAPGLGIASALHEVQYTRLFRS